MKATIKMNLLTYSYLIAFPILFMDKKEAEKAVAALFNALFSLTDVRSIFREAKPSFKFSDAQKNKVKKSLELTKEAIKTLEKFFEL